MRKLKIAKETVRRLSGTELAAVEGGSRVDEWTHWENSCQCDPPPKLTGSNAV